MPPCSASSLSAGLHILLPCATYPPLQQLCCPVRLAALFGHVLLLCKQRYS